MFVDGLGSDVELVLRMQPGDDFQICFVMFNHVKRVKSWTTIARHVFDLTYCKFMTIVVCNMQTKWIEGQFYFWHCLNKIMAQNEVSDPNFKEFICDSAQTNLM